MLRMRWFITAVAVLAPIAAMAQTDPSKPTPEMQMQALSSTVLDLTNQNVMLRTQLIHANTRVSELQAQLQAAKNQASKPTPDEHAKP